MLRFSVAKDYVRLLKFGDSLYRCKQLKKAALGRMATIMKRQASNLTYLEEVRQHLSRLPSIDPYTRTVIVCGFPNVGKSSFLNKVTRADVDVQPYAFTTKSLYVGHMDYKYLRWQVIDTPGILDHPLEERNVIEMQAITAMAHLRACIMYVMDVSEQCGHSIEEQAKLFDSIKPLFANKPLVLVLNKTDVLKFDELPADKQQIIEALSEDREVIPILEMSTATEEGVMEVKVEACERLLGYRVDQKLKTKKLDGVLNRLHVAMPEKRDGVERPACIPETVLAARAANAEKLAKRQRKLEKEIEQEMGDEYTLDLKKNYTTIPEEERYDVIPEFLNGVNIADYIDADIFEKLEELEREEGLRMDSGFYEPPPLNMDETLQEIREMAKQIRLRRFQLKDARKLAQKSGRPIMPRHKQAMVRVRKADDLRKTMENLGLDMSGTEDTNFAKNQVSVKRSVVPAVGGPKTPKKDRESSAVWKATGLPLKQKTPRNELGIKDVMVSGGPRTGGFVFLLESKRSQFYLSFPLLNSLKRRPRSWRNTTLRSVLRRCRARVRPIGTYRTLSRSICSPASAARAKPTAASVVSVGKEAFAVFSLFSFSVSLAGTFVFSKHLQNIYTINLLSTMQL